MMNKEALYEIGGEVLRHFCAINDLPPVQVTRVKAPDWHVSVCAYYRKGEIKICVDRCASIGTAGRQWSYPGNTVDRTPYGVLQHELGHHVDVMLSNWKGLYYGDFSVHTRAASGEKPITTYCPNDAEWFAEMFRVFVTNPDLLRLVRPATYGCLSARFTPVFADSWRDRLRDAPARTIAATEKKVEALA